MEVLLLGARVFHSAQRTHGHMQGVMRVFHDGMWALPTSSSRLPSPRSPEDIPG